MPGHNWWWHHSGRNTESQERDVIKTIIHHCQTSYKFKVKASQQLMSELPSARVQPARPFTTSGIDYAGPIVLWLGSTRSKQTIKGYIAIFVCDKGSPYWTCHKPHHWGTPCCLKTFHHTSRKTEGHPFRHRNQCPRCPISSKRYNTLQRPTQMTRVQDFLTTEGNDWRFIPPHGPHFGGLWEAAVKSMKYHLRRTLGAQLATYEELNTLLVEIEACLNSRPLCALPNDPHTSYLSPGHFLIGEPLSYPLLTILISKWIECPGSRHFNNSRTTGRRGPPTTFTSSNIINAGTIHPPTYNLEIPWSWRRTTRLHSTGPQRSSPMSTQTPTATRVVTVKTPKGTFKHAMAKFAPYRMLKNEL